MTQLEPQGEITRFSLHCCLGRIHILIISALGLYWASACTLHRGHGAQIEGSWEFALTFGPWNDKARVELQRAGNTVTGHYSGVLGMNKAVKGTYKNQQLSLSFDGEWP